ncbi:conserved hypothetical protein [Sporisorium reilianum SRZ2]|uniref:Uncharacterized protein n=1 Tax=Sporisorium reilianum (strain SRZ2) TaxID=999809 RepID=E6ZVS3_SPORE|nr:conserved hypothetical protein [Sporisorium reilianum SRZ2]
MATAFSKATASMRPLARGFASSTRTLSESAPSAAAPASASSAPRPPRSNNQSQRSSQTGNSSSDRPRAGQRNRSAQKPGQNRNAGNDRRNKRLPSVFDAASASAQSRPSGGASVKSLTHGSQKMPAPVPSTDWNSALFSKPGFERLLASAPRASLVFVPNLAAAAPSAPAGGKGKGKAAAAAPAKVAGAKLNLPGIKTAVNALKLHIRPGGRNVLGPLNNPTAVASGFLSRNSVAVSPKAASDKSLAEELKAARIALQNEKIGGSYERFEPQEVAKAAGAQAKGNKAVQDAAQALALNADLAPEGKGFVAKTIAERLSV